MSSREKAMLIQRFFVFLARKYDGSFTSGVIFARNVNPKASGMTSISRRASVAFSK
jgi:hypothetical protein